MTDRFITDHDFRNAEYQVYDKEKQTIIRAWPDYKENSLQRAMAMCRALNNQARHRPLSRQQQIANLEHLSPSPRTPPSPPAPAAGLQPPDGSPGRCDGQESLV